MALQHLTQAVSTHSRPKAAADAAAAISISSEFQHTAARRRLPRIHGQKNEASGQFQHTAARRRLRNGFDNHFRDCQFQHTAARRRLRPPPPPHSASASFQHTAARRRLQGDGSHAAEGGVFQHTAARRRLPGPPQSGLRRLHVCFNTQPPEGGCGRRDASRPRRTGVSTHSRPKAAARKRKPRGRCALCFNTQPPEGGCFADGGGDALKRVSTHSRPKAAASSLAGSTIRGVLFQHTAARRRLHALFGWRLPRAGVSTHSRPKAAAAAGCLRGPRPVVSTHSRPKAAAPYLKTL